MKAIAILVLVATTASASPRVAKQAREMRAALVDARRECKRPGAKLEEMVHADGKRWLFDGEWFCGKNLFWDN